MSIEFLHMKAVMARRFGLSHSSNLPAQCRWRLAQKQIVIPMVSGVTRYTPGYSLIP
jgi:hypothetical protein